MTNPVDQFRALMTVAFPGHEFDEDAMRSWHDYCAQPIGQARDSTMQHVEYQIIRADGTVTDHVVELPEPDKEWKPTPSANARKRYEAVSKVVLSVIGEDRDLEHVNVWHDGKYLDMFVDETSALDGLPENRKATAIYHANMLAHEPPDSALRKDMPSIYGDAVLFLQQVWR